VEQAPSVADEGPVRAVDILTDRLPSVPDKPPTAADGTTKPETAGTPDSKPATAPKIASKPVVVPTGMTNKPAVSGVNTTNSTAKPAGQAKPPAKPNSTPESNPQ
jgi:hypothetical protein